MRVVAASRSAVVLAAVAAVAFMPGCGGDDSPAAPAPSPSPVVVASPTPAPIPSPNLPGMASCSRLPVAPATGHRCDMGGPTYQAELEQSIAELRRDQPGIFQETSGGTLILSPGRFFVGVIENLDKKGLCADFDTEEIGIARTSEFNDQFHLRTSRGFLRFGPSIYRATCYPSAVPIQKPPFLPNNGCRLAPSREVACSREEQFLYLNDIEAAIDQVMREHPEMFDFGRRAPGTAWPAVVNFDGYHDQIVRNLIAKGYCAIFDTEEIQLKKESRFSEHYDVHLGDGFVRRGEGSYRSTCWPAAF